MKRTAKATRLENYEHKLMIDIYEASEFLGLKVSRLRMAVFRGEIPYRKVGALVRFVPSELKEWVDSEAVRPRMLHQYRGGI